MGSRLRSAVGTVKVTLPLGKEAHSPGSKPYGLEVETEETVNRNLSIASK